MDILMFTLKSVAVALTQPYWAIILLLLAFVFYRQNKKTVIMQKMIIGQNMDSAFELTISQIVIGIFAGIIASVMLSYLGVVFDESSSIDLLFIISVLLMFLNPRFICFSYSGAVLGMLSILVTIFGGGFKDLDLLKIDIVSLMTMVGVLHLVEGMITMLDGHRGAVPIFTNRGENIVGGFALQRYWALPLAIFFMIHDKSLAGSGWTVALPGWWPLIKTSIPLDVIKTALVILIPFYGVVGYSGVTFTKSCKGKAFSSGALIVLYSIVLIGIAQFSNINIFTQIIIVLFAPLGHEGIMAFQRYRESTGKPKYISNEQGIMVLVVAPNSPAMEMGIESGDLLMEVNNRVVQDEETITEMLKETANFVWFKIKKVTGELKEVNFNRLSKERYLGIIFVPKKIPKGSMVLKVSGDPTTFKDYMQKLKDKEDKDD